MKMEPSKLRFITLDRVANVELFIDKFIRSLVLMYA